jgi:hypothetical protein
MASLVVVVHEFVSQRYELDAGGPLVTIVGGNVTEEVLGLFLETVCDDVVGMSGMPVLVEGGWRPIMAAWVVATGTVIV